MAIPFISAIKSAYILTGGSYVMQFQKAVRPLRGEISVPGDKSISHRAVMFGAISEGTTEVTNFLQGADCLSTISCFRSMGIEIENTPERILVHGKGLHGLSAPSAVLDCGNSGTTTRLISGILAGQNFSSTLTGDASIQKRPMGRIINPLTQMGASIRSIPENGCAPLAINAHPLHAISYLSPVASAQVKSCVLLAGLYADGKTSVTEPALSRNHTELMLKFFGATSEVLPYAQEYTRITAIGFPFLIANTGMSKLILADGSPRYSMTSMLVGAIVNTILDPIFIFGLHMGMRGAALATIIGQIVSFCISLRYMFHFKTIRLTKESFHMTGRHIENIFKFGASACFNQIAMTIVQIVLNNTLSHYGAQSVYGGDIPLACAGIITKVNMIFMSFVIGISQGIQPIIGFNYGAEKYERVRKSYLLALGTATVLSGIAFFCFQVFPRQIISVFGSGSELYFQFSERYFRIYMFLTLINGIQPVTSNFFNSIGKSQLGVFMSLTRQILFLLPLIMIFPLFMGIDGVMYAGPIADAAAAIVCGYFMVRELKELSAMDRKKKEEYAA